MRNLTKNKIVLLILGFIFGFSIIANLNFNYYQGKNYGNLEDDTTTNESQDNEILKSNNGGISLITPEDKVYYKPMSGYYPGTNSFDHDEVGTEPIWFQEVGTDGGTVQVIDELDGHNSVLELHDTSAINNSYVLKTLFMGPRNGTIEFWMRTDNASKGSGFSITGYTPFLSTEIIISVRIWSNYIQYWNTTDWVNIFLIQNDKWIHIRLDFECSSGQYQELSQHTWCMYVNGGLASEAYPFMVNRYKAVQIVWFTDFVTPYADHYYYYIDAIAFSWIDHCNIADNMNDGLLLKYEGPSNLTWRGYSLDGLDNITILGETAIPRPGNGMHSIRVFGKDSEGTVYSSESRIFEVNNPTLVLIPGIGGDSTLLHEAIISSMLDLNNNGTSDFIDYYGAQNIFNVSYYEIHTNRPEFTGIKGAWDTSIKTIANAVKNYIINEFNEGHIKKNVDLLAWSMGGLVIRSMIKEHYNELKKAGITIIHAGIYGTPHHGQWLANSVYWYFENNNTLTPELKQTCYFELYTFSEFLIDLNLGDETPYDIYFNTYRGTGKYDKCYWMDFNFTIPVIGNISIPAVAGNDDLDPILVNQIINMIGIFGDGVVSTRSAVLSGAVNNRAYHKVSHSGIMKRPEVQKDMLWDLKHYPLGEVELNSPKNQTYYKPMDGYYPGTNSFDHDEIGCQPAWFLEVGTDGGTVDPIEGLDGHNTVLDLHDTNETDNVYVKKNIPLSPSSGTIEYWMRTDNASAICGFHLSGGIFPNPTIPMISVLTWFDSFVYWNETEWINITTIQNNKWYHLRIDFECTGGNYSGLAQYTWCLYINGLQYGPFPFINNQNFVRRIELNTDWIFGFSDYHYYIDAIGFSWDSNYKIADNMNEGLLLGFDKNFEHRLINCSLDGGPIYRILGNKSIPLPDDGPHSIQVFSQEWSGELCQSEVRYFTIDTSPPEITINSPNQNDLFGITAPSFELSIIDPNLDDTWYTLDGGITNITFTGLTLTINQAEWDKKSDGTVSVRFYANNSWGYEGFEDITLRKDAYVPDITIHSPLSNERFGNNPPEFNISIVEDDLVVSTWYTIEGITGNFYFTEFNGTIDQDAWEDLSEGEINITFYAVDRAGNEGFKIVMVIKRIPSRQAISGYNLIFLFGILSVIALIISTKIRTYDK